MTTWLTQDAYDKLKTEYEQLSTTGREEVVKKIAAAREEGDLRENGGYHAAREEQGKLEDQFDAALAQEAASTTSTSSTTTTTTLPGTAPGSTTTTTTLPPAPPPPEGDAVARIQIPKIGVDSIVVNGVSRDDLRKGPGHYPDTPMPGQFGNAAIAGHRTTYGAPFGDLDQLNPGDLIQVRTLQGNF